jgi:hypothetical protein
MYIHMYINAVFRVTNVGAVFRVTKNSVFDNQLFTY